MYRYAIAKLEISKNKAIKWVLALNEEDDITQLKDEKDFFGFTVDAGLGSFCDYETSMAYNKFVEEFMAKNPDGNIYDNFFSLEFKKNAQTNHPSDYGNWVNFQLPTSDLNIIIFQSGYGDGIYPSYWGIDDKGEITSLVIDFFVLLTLDE